MITGCTILSRLTQNFETKPNSLIPVNPNKSYEKEASMEFEMKNHVYIKADREALNILLGGVE